MVFEFLNNLSINSSVRECLTEDIPELCRPKEFRTKRGFLGNEPLELTEAVRTVSTRRNLFLGMNAEGIFLAEKLFSVTIVNNDGKHPVRYVGDQHVREELGPHSHSPRLVAPDQATALDVRAALGDENRPMQEVIYDRPQWPCL
jgi:hypothetical protein